MAAYFERLYPYVAALIAAGLCYRYEPTLGKTTVNLLSSVVDLAGVTVGFLAAAEAIILSMNTRVIVHLKKLGGYDRLVNFLNEAIALWVALAAMSVVGLLRDFDQHQWPLYAVMFWVFLASAAVLSYYRVVRVFYKILKSPR